MSASLSYPEFGSPEHKARIARRLSQNLRIRRLAEDATRLIAEYEKRRRQFA